MIPMRLVLLVLALPLTAIAPVTAATVSTGCIEGSGRTLTEKRAPGSFRAVEINGVFDVQIQLGQEGKLEVSGDDNIVPRIQTAVRGDVLTIRADQSICPKLTLEVRLAAPDIGRLTVEGTNEVRLSGVNNQKLALEIGGSSNLRAEGRTGQLKLDLPGSSKVEAADLHSQSASIRISGVGEAEVHATQALEVTISGVGNVVYAGKPAKVTQNITGVGEISPR
jgi:hypothetical protein